MKMSKTRDTEALSFEEAFRALQDVVGRMEKGNLSLDESVALFELGTKLVHRCTTLLDQAELKVRTLSQDFIPEVSVPSNEADEAKATDDGSAESLLWDDE